MLKDITIKFWFEEFILRNEAVLNSVLALNLAYSATIVPEPAYEIAQYTRYQS